MDRPARKTKSVNYCEAKDFDDDEDFATVKAPPSKKAREDVRPHEPKKSSSKSSSQESNSQSSQSHKSRKPLDEKLLDRDLEAAITLSLLNNVDCVQKQAPACADAVKVELQADENTDPSFLHVSNCSVVTSSLGLDEITSERDASAPAKQRKAASKAADQQRKSLQEEDDDDYEPKLTPDSDSDEDFSEAAESDDEEFRVKKSKKTSKKDTASKKDKPKQPPASKKEKQPPKLAKSKSQPAASPQVKSPPTVKFAAKRPAAAPAAAAAATATTTTTVYTSKPVSPAGAKVPKWIPPAKIGKSPTSSNSPTLKSPGQGLRLGLSRRVRVKPLHPSVASH